MTGWGSRARLYLVLAAAALGSLAPVAPAAAGVGVGHSGWEWSNPVPQGNTLRALDFAGPTGYAVGEFGTLMRTDDSGETWVALRSGTTDELTHVVTVEPDVFVVAGGCGLWRSDDGGASSRRLRLRGSGFDCESPIVGLAFPAGDLGYLLTEDGRLYRSADGVSWSPAGYVPLEPGRRPAELATDLTFVDRELGFATTSEGIYRTVDGGVSWIPGPSRPGGFESVHFAGALVGYAAGPGAAVFKTLDGGRTWRPTGSAGGAALGGLSAAAGALESIRCADPLRCLVTTGSAHRLLRTVDGGASWEGVSLPAGTAALAVAFSPLAAATAGLGGTIATSGDGGASWSAVGGALGGSYSRLRGGDGFLAFAIGDRGALARTDDGGRSWIDIAVPTSEALVDVSFGSPTEGVALDLAGTLYRTDDGGTRWRVIGSGSHAQAVLALDGDRIMLVGPRGILRSRDGGLTFGRVGHRALRRAVLFGIDRAGSSLFAYGPTSLFVSRNLGKRWKKVARPDHRPLAVVDFVSSRTGYTLSKGGRVWRTRNRGRSWRELRATGSDGGIELAFSSALEGYLVSNDLFFAEGDRRPDYVLRTADGGRTWRPQLVSDSRDFSGILATGESIDLLLASGRELFSTTTGGDSGARSRLRLRAVRRRAKGPRKVTLRGRLTPAEGGERVIVSRTEADPRRRRGAIDWRFKTARVRSNGRFSSTWRVRRTSVFVAQWTGSQRLRGAGSKAIEVRVAER